MRPAKERFFVVTWSLYGIASTCMIAGLLAANYQRERTYTGPQTAIDWASVEKATGEFSAEANTLAAYKAGRMTADDARSYEEMLRIRSITPPPGQTVTVPGRFDIVPVAAAIVAAVLAVPVLLGMALQYLVLGFASPLLFFRR